MARRAMRERFAGLGQMPRLYAFVRPYTLQMAVALVAIVIGSGLALAGPYAVQFLIDAVFQQHDADLLNRLTLLFFAIFALQSLTYFVRGYLLSYIGERVMADMRIRLFAHLEGLSLGFFNNRRTGDLISRLSNDVSTVRGVVTSDVSAALSQMLTFVGSLALILITSWQLTVFMFALVPIIVFFAFLLGRQLRIISSSVQDQLASATIVLEEALSGIRVVQSFTREQFELQRYTRAIAEMVALSMRRIRLSAMFGPLVSFLGFASVVSIFWFGGNEVLAGRLTAGQLFLFLILTLSIAGSLGQFSGLYTSLQEALGATTRLFEILDTAAEISDAPGAVDLPRVEGHIEFDAVSFAYADQPTVSILKEVSFKIRPGEVLALVGPSGAGKSTLANLLPRFFDPTTGRICIDGFNIRHVRVASLRAQVGLVPQETLLFGGTVRENILYGKSGATDTEMVAAAQAANAHDFITALSKGYDTVIGERGVKLSGGQRQRVSIARALLKDPRILLLDEATSSLDSESEGLVREALQRLMRGRTSLVIAHRLSTVQNASRIAVLDGGTLVEIGTHLELLASNGLYARLYRMQFRDDPSTLGTHESEEERAQVPAPPPPQPVRRLFPGLPGR